MSTTYQCEKQHRLERVRAHATLSGIEWLEVLDGAAPADSPRQQTLLIRMVKPLDGTLATGNVRIEAPTGAAAVGVTWAEPATAADALRTDGTITDAERTFLLALPDVARVLVVRTDGTGDHSTYRLRLVTSATDASPPAGIDLRLAEIGFRLKVECPSPFDCRAAVTTVTKASRAPAIDYLAKDYASFRRLMLDRLAILLPAWRDRSAGDLGITLVELLAYVGDHLSYAQDAVATEAYLQTARRRTSVRRHARLLDYKMHDGTNARAWVHVRASTDTTLPERLPLRTAGERALVFETKHGLDVHVAHNQITLYTWSDEECCLPAGATQATLLSVPNTAKGTPPLRLRRGDVLVFEEIVSPRTGLAIDADLDRRHVVRLTEVGESKPDPLTGDEVVEVAWHTEDALPFALDVSARIPQGDGSSAVRAVSCARGNMVLVDEGQSVTEQLDPERVTAGRYRPRLRQQAVARAEEYDHSRMKARSAAAAVRQDPRAALPADMELSLPGETWRPRHDLLASDRTVTEFVLESEEDGRAWVRFGDDTFGKAPAAGSQFTATYRVGNGSLGNVGIGAIRVCDLPGIESVRNPMPAVGGTDPESLNEVRVAAPQAFRRQERAVTVDDYARVVERLDEVQRAAARYRWTGSWLTVFVTIDRVGGRSVRGDAEFLAKVEAWLERYRMAGFDVEIRDPVYVPLEIELDVCVAKDHFRANVQTALLLELGSTKLADGRMGFFHPDAFTFGQPVYLSGLYARALRVDGVASVEVKRFQRYGKAANQELQAGVLKTADLEVARLDNDPSRPENGRLTMTMAGGL